MPRSKAWKSDETWFARFFGYIGRTSLSGGNSKSGTRADNHPDRHPSLPKGKLYIEHKRKKKDALANLLAKEYKKAKKEGKTVVIGVTSGRDRYIFCRVKDLEKVAKERRQAKKVDMEEVIELRVKIEKKKILKMRRF